MKPAYFILNGDNIFATVYKGKNKIVFVHAGNIDLEHPLLFKDSYNDTVEDEEVMNILLSTITGKLEDIL